MMMMMMILLTIGFTMVYHNRPLATSQQHRPLDIGGQVILKPSHAYYDEYYSYKGFVRHRPFFPYYEGLFLKLENPFPARSMLKNHALETCRDSTTAWCRERIQSLQEPLFSWSNLRWTQTNSGWYDSKSWSVELVCALKKKQSSVSIIR